MIEIYSFIEVKNIYADAIWTGASDREVEGTFKWIDGEIFSGKWNPGEPTNLYNSDCVLLLPNGKFDDGVCSGRRAFVCEKQQLN
jgi:hypothetical protein